MALYRTERRLSWNHALRIGHWYAPWSETQADTGTDYFSRTLGWLRHKYPKANIASDSHALPATSTSWPQERFGLPIIASEANAANSNGGTAAPADGTPGEATLEQPAHAGDLLLVEWPQALPAANTAPAESAQQDANASPAQPPRGSAALPEHPQADAPAPLSNDAAQPSTLPPLWVNGLERALRRTWQDNPLAEVIFIGGAAGICPSGLALAAHYGVTVINPAALLHPGNASGTDYRQAFIQQGKAAAPDTLTAQGHEIWAGMLISMLREQLRYGPTPDPVNLPDGLWCRS